MRLLSGERCLLPSLQEVTVEGEEWILYAVLCSPCVMSAPLEHTKSTNKIINVSTQLSLFIAPESVPHRTPMRPSGCYPHGDIWHRRWGASSESSWVIGLLWVRQERSSALISRGLVPYQWHWHGILRWDWVERNEVTRWTPSEGKIMLYTSLSTPVSVL